jgi:RNA polymerase sigma-70 factor (ECF subfamily)
VDLDALFRRVYPQLFRYLHRLTGNPDTADDLAQESFVRLVSRPLPEEEAKPWLFRVATNLFLDGARTARRRERILSVVPFEPAALPRPDEEVEHAERVRQVRETLDRLPERDRVILLMRAEGFRYEEIARAVGVAPGSIGTLLARATRRFTTAYSGQEGDDDASA